MNEQSADETERRMSATRRPEDERKVWAESYPGGDTQIEVGHMDKSEELYLMSGESEALREILNELSGDSSDDLEHVNRAMLKLNSLEDILSSKHNDEMAQKAALEMVRAARDELEEVDL